MAMLVGAILSPDVSTPNAFAGNPDEPKRRSVIAPEGKETEGLPVATSRADLLLLFKQPPVVPGDALFTQGHSVQPIRLPPSPEQESGNSE